MELPVLQLLSAKVLAVVTFPSVLAQTYIQETKVCCKQCINITLTGTRLFVLPERSYAGEL